MPHLGLPELVIMLIAAISAAIPISTLAFSLLTWRAVRRIEARLSSSS